MKSPLKTAVAAGLVGIAFAAASEATGPPPDQRAENATVEGTSTTPEEAHIAGICGAGNNNDCCQSNDSPGCMDGDCCSCVCDVDSFCCEDSWDSICLDIANTDCAAACECAPRNDDCVGAERIALPSSPLGTTENATDDFVPECDTAITTPGVWYSVIGNGNRLTASTCTEFVNYDTKITVFCGDCEDLVCIAGNDDDCLDYSALNSTVEWCSESGREYFILVHGFGGETGGFQLNVYDDGSRCDDPPDCMPVQGACCAPQGCETTSVCNDPYPCGGTFDCFCAATSEGTPSCLLGTYLCESLAPCPNGTSDCDPGQVCVVESCCAGPVCTPEGCPTTASVDRTPEKPGLAISGMIEAGFTSCVETTLDECESVNGIFVGDGTSCDNNPCQLLEACCIDGTCIDLVRQVCVENGGDPQGPGTFCDADTCGPAACNPNAGPCLEPHGTPGCDDLDCCELVCDFDSFCCDVEWDGICVERALDFCVPRACCMPISCTDIPPAFCGAAGGLPQEPGSNCNNTTCEFDPPCEICGPGPHWIDAPPCLGGTDNLPSSALVGIDLNLDCEADVSLVMNGPSTVHRTNPLDDSLNYPGVRPLDGHLETIDTEMVALRLSGGGLELRAGQFQGANALLVPSLGVIAEILDDPPLAESFFDIFFEIGMPTGGFLYNHDPVRVVSLLDCLPPDTTYVHIQGCLPLFDRPPGAPGEPVHLANFVAADHSTYPECGDPGTGSCYEPHDTPLCSDGPCCELVCDLMPFCCDVEWSENCAGVALQLCSRACCMPDLTCVDTSREACLEGGGQPQEPGSDCSTTVCQEVCGNPESGDCCDAHTGTPGCDDANCCAAVCGIDPFCCDTEWDVFCAAEAEDICGCPACPDGNVAWLVPEDNFVDARQPSPVGAPLPLLGVDRLVVLAPAGAGNADCWTLCETNQHPELHQQIPPNSIVDVINELDGRYTIVLDHPLTPGEATALAYVSATGMTVESCKYIAHPADVNGDGTSALPDILSLIDSLNEVIPLPLSQTDIDRSELPGGSDILRVIDLLNGAGSFERWLEVTVDHELECPPTDGP